MRGAAGVLAAGFVLTASVTPADDLKKVSAEEQALQTVPSDPDAVAVVLQKVAKFHMRDIAAQEPSSKLTVLMRTKILKEAGRSYGEIAIVHDDDVRLSGFEGKVTSPSGKETKVPKNAKFERKVSESLKRAVTAIAFPNVEVGSIIDYKYDLSFDSLYFADAFMFSDRIPVMKAEVRFEIPFQIAYRGWARQPPDTIQVETVKSANFIVVTARAANLGAVPDEPFAPSFEDLGVQMFLFPNAYRDPDVHIPIMESWPSVAETIDTDYYGPMRKKSAAAEAKGRALATADQEGTLISVFKFVRDSVETAWGPGPWSRGKTIDDVLAQQRGNSADKALLVQAMLRGAGIASTIVWASDRRARIVDSDVPNPAWYPRTLVMVERPVGRIYLDTSDRTLAYGRLSHGFEGAAAVLHDPKNPVPTVLPMSSFVAHGRKLTLDLAVDAEGRTTGRGALRYRGHSAWRWIEFGRDKSEVDKEWKDFVAGRLPGFEVNDLKVVESIDDATVDVSFSLAARAEAVLGDEVSLQLSRPLGPETQPFPAHPSSRRTPVHLEFASQDEVVANVSWAEGWADSTRPLEVQKPAAIGAFAVRVTPGPNPRSLRYERTFQIRSREPKGLAEFTALHGLHAEAEKSDAQALLLVRR